MSETAPAPPSGATATGRRPLIAHVVPFVAWMALMALLGYIGPEGAWRYAVRTGLCLGLLVALRPWRWYPRLRVRNLPLGLLVGVVVFVIWVGPELGSEPYPMLQEMYLRFCILPLGGFPEAQIPNLYDPAVCGWGLTLVRLAGSAFVIAIIEEFFWRGFLYRWLVQRDFLRLDLGRFDREGFLMMCLLFGVEHHRWLVGAVAGAAYGWLMIRTRDIWAAVFAHMVTNFLLGLYVLAYGKYVFW